MGAAGLRGLGGLPRSLRARIALAAVAALALGGSIAGVLLLAAVERDGRRAVDAQLAAQADDLGRGALRPRGGPRQRPGRFGPRRPFRRFDPGRLRGPDLGDEGLLAGSGSFVQVAVAGRVVRRGDVPADPPALPARDGLATVDIGGVPWRSLTFTEPGRPGRGARLQLLASLAPVQERVASIRGLVLALGLAALALTALIAWGLTTVALRPLGRLRAGAARVTGARDLAEPLPEDAQGPEEVLALARSLNEMLARLGAASAAQDRALAATRRFAADAGHELRTPLTSVQASLSSLARHPELPAERRTRMLGDALDQQRRLVGLLDGLQALARGDAAPEESEVDLAEVADAALSAARERHPQAAWHCELPDAPVALRGWEPGLRSLVDNLLENAARHGGGTVRLELRPGELCVEDDGPGVPAADRERILDPFVRLGGDDAPPGSGLGLPLVAQQAAHHGAALEVGDSAALGGARFAVRWGSRAAG